MSSDQLQGAKDTASRTAEETKQVGGEKAVQAQKNGQGLGETAQDKAGQAGDLMSEKWGQAKDGASDTAQAAQDKAVEGKENTGNVFQQAGSKITETFNNLTNN
uniref:Late embryogenesis abundant protein n=1 Tax=Apopellia endiviifolia (species B) TaxID=119729 RepID=C9WCK2_9MARC|nr:late embryogenesis abundant protein [Apopellia endiviifolia (species B)]ACR38896.1 late embryogenesis abundant protein [Apopellia endiviifolia (species B)]